jgi:hypothetical protein
VIATLSERALSELDAPLRGVVASSRKILADDRTAHVGEHPVVEALNRTVMHERHLAQHRVHGERGRPQVLGPISRQNPPRGGRREETQP